MDPRDEFYVGYESAAPRETARRTRGAVVILVLGALAIAALLVTAQSRFARSRFEFGVTRSFTGILRAAPYPVLLVPRPGSDSFSAYLLTVSGKFGAVAAIEGWAGRPVTIDGSLIHRGDRVMVEIAPDGIGPWEGETAAAALARLDDGEADLGLLTVTGEIVDSKCYLGVMKPGAWKPHRACAIRCISGGVPPVLVERWPGPEQARHFLLVDGDGRPVNDRVLDRVAEPLRITGRVVLRNDQYVLHADPDTYESSGFTVIRPRPAAEKSP